MNLLKLNTETQRRGWKRQLLLLCLLCASVLLSNTARAAEPPKITIVADQVWLRTAPSLIAANTTQVLKGQFYDVAARTADGAWWQLMPSDAFSQTAQTSKGGTWLFAPLGAAYSGDVKNVAVAQASSVALVTTPVAKTSKKPKSVKAAKDAPLPAWIPQITPQQRAIWQNVGRDPSFFTVVGDCNSQPPVYLQRLASGHFDASTLSPRLQSIVQQFWRSFGRVSLAAKGGFGSASMMDPAWADGGLCDARGGTGPFACELKVSNASVVFISLGTQEQYDWKNFEKNFRPIIEHALSKGVLPVLVTKADDIETAAGAPSNYINDIVRKLAKEYSVPLLDFYAATRELPYGGLINEGDKNFHQSYLGMDRRILATLQTLAVITGK